MVNYTRYVRTLLQTNFFIFCDHMQIGKGNFTFEVLTLGCENRCAQHAYIRNSQ